GTGPEGVSLDEARDEAEEAMRASLAELSGAVAAETGVIVAAAILPAAGGAVEAGGELDGGGRDNTDRDEGRGGPGGPGREPGLRRRAAPRTARRPRHDGRDQALAAEARYRANVQSLLPTKLSGVAQHTAIACATTSGDPSVTSVVRTTKLKPKATRLTAR